MNLATLVLAMESRRSAERCPLAIATITLSWGILLFVSNPSFLTIR